MSKEKANNGQKSLASPPKKSVFEPKSLIEKGLLISDQFCFKTVVSIYLDMIGLFLGWDEVIMHLDFENGYEWFE